MNKEGSARLAFLEIHVAVLLFGFTAILGDLIKLDAVMLVWWRILLTIASIPLFVGVLHRMKNLDRSLLRISTLIGFLVALHWVTFFGAIKLANASIALVCFASVSLMTALLEPFIMKKPVDKQEVLLGLLVIPGMVLVVEELDPSYFWGFAVGLLSALCSAIFSTLNKKIVHRENVMFLTFLQLAIAFLVLTLVVIVLWFGGNIGTFWPSTTDWIYLCILAILCTTLAYYLAFKALKHLSAFTTNLTINLEPLYGIILAWLILNEDEQLTRGFYIGAALILVAILVHFYIIWKQGHFKKDG